MAATKDKRIPDPVLPDQGGRMMAVDPLGINVFREEALRKKAYEVYEQRRGKDGNVLRDWVKAERELQQG